MADIWEKLKDKLPYGKSPEETELRNKYWAGFDVNGNGYLSLAEVDKGMRDVIVLPELFELKPVLMRAFQSAKSKLKSKNEHGDDYVSKAEFRYLLLYLRQYYEYWVAFDIVDKDDDRRVSREEFETAIPVMKKWGIEIGDPDEGFKEADKDGHGKVLFIEFCQWAIEKQLDLEDDDDAV